MNSHLKDREHYLRAAILLAAGIVLFLVVRGLLVPKDFGALGHYRPGALADNQGHPVSFAGMTACEECHSDVVEARTGSRHSQVHCEACHGALATHAQDPDAVKPVLPDPRKLCPVCHEANTARPPSFPQVVTEEHAGDQSCTECHRPHHPEIE